MFLELVILKVGFYLIGSGSPHILDMIAYAAYKYGIHHTHPPLHQPRTAL
jgi:hypothetical protein